MRALLTIATLFALAACDDGSSGGAGGTGSGGSTTGTGGTAGAGGTGTGGSTAGGSGGTGGTGGATIGEGELSDLQPGTLPVPPGPDDLPAPSGSEANLRVLPWAGFTAAVSYTFDDSQPSQIEHYEELAAAGVPLTFYVTSSSSGSAGYLTTFQDALAQGHEIGNHTAHHCHANLADCSGALPTLEEEIDSCTAHIKDDLGQAGVWTFAHPFGDGGYQPYLASRFLLARGVASGSIPPGAATNPLNLPVMAAVGGEAGSVFSGHIDTAQAQGRWLVFLFHSILPTSQNWYAGVEIASITESIEHAKDLGDVWIDSVISIGAYWLGHRALEAATPVTEGDTTTWSWELPVAFTGRTLRVAVDGGTLSQGGEALEWDGHGYYEVALDAGSLTWNP